jgi:hypothetical protein
MISKPQKNAKQKMGVTGQIIVAKKATAVVDVVSNIAEAASGNAIAAISWVGADGLSSRAFFHLSTATNTSSAPSAAATKIPMKLRKGKLERNKVWDLCENGTMIAPALFTTNKCFTNTYKFNPAMK